MAIRRHRRGSLFVELRIGGERRNVDLAELICIAFHGPRPVGTECLFLDGDRENRRPDNLRWGLMPEDVPDPSVEFRLISEFPGYRFGSDGSIWSTGGRPRARESDVWKKLNPARAKSGHLRLNLFVAGRRRTFGAHQLICWAFHGRCPEGMECCHKDGVPFHNTPDNLRWGTPKENAQDQILHGVKPRGERNPFAKLTEQDVRDMRAAYESGGTTVAALARKYKVCHATADDAIARRKWRHVT